MLDKGSFGPPYDDDKLEAERVRASMDMISSGVCWCVPDFNSDYTISLIGEQVEDIKMKNDKEKNE